MQRAMKVLAAGLLLLLAACGQQELYTKLSEAQANEMVAVLQNAGIRATKEDAGEGAWRVTTATENFARSIEVLHAQGYPRAEFADLGTVFKKEGFVSSPLEERARLVYGLSQELSDTVSRIDGVVEARVHLAMPETDPLAEKQRPSSASVFIKYRPGVDLDRQVGQIKALVVNSVEDLSYDNVTVATFPAQPLPGASSGGMRGPLALTSLETTAYVVLLIGGVVFGYPAWRRWRLRRRALARRGGTA